MTSTHLSQSAPTRNTWSRAAVTGAGAGIVASLAMAMYAMVAAWVKDTGFFTPLYHIASLVISKDSMMASMQDAMGGAAFHFTFGPAVLGAMIHMMTGALYGAVFGVTVSRLSLGKGLVIGAGLAYGALVLALSTCVGLPVAAAVLDSGDQITHMARMAGWGTFVVEHLVFGLTLGALLVSRPTREPALTAEVAGPR